MEIRHMTRLRLLVRPLSERACIFCQYQKLHSSAKHLQDANPKNASAPKPPPPPKPVRPHLRVRDGELVPKPLTRPLGMEHPPQPGQNTGRDTRTWSQWWEDYKSFDKHMERQQAIMKAIFEKSYYHDINNLGVVHLGKSILAPTTPYRATLARYFPNFEGITPASRGTYVDTTPLLRHHVSIVSVMNTMWQKYQCDSFVGKDVNPALHTLLDNSELKELVQAVNINVETNYLKWGLVRMFMPRQRRLIPAEQHPREFLVRRGLTDEISEALGIWNFKVGYVYLLDGECRIRWAGNGPARPDERISLVNCVKRLVDEARGVQRMRVTRQDPRPTGSVKKVDEPVKQRLAATAA